MPRLVGPSNSIALWAAFLLLGCSSRRQIAAAHDPGVQSPATVDAASAARSSPETGPDSGPSTTRGILSITDPSVLQALEARGMSFGEMIDGAERRESANGLLAGAPRYGALTKTLERDIDELRRADPNAGVSVAKFSHRLFDTRWLRSPAARFELIAIVNRIDRTGIVGGCGEVRFVYRLAYKVGNGDASIASRLPMTVSFEMNALAGDAASCKSAAERWYPPSTEKEELVSWLLSEKGPLSPAQRRLESLRRLAVNVQSVRWPSTVRPDLGGHQGRLPKGGHGAALRKNRERGEDPGPGTEKIKEFHSFSEKCPEGERKFPPFSPGRRALVCPPGIR